MYDGVLYRMLKKRLGPPSAWPTGFDVLIVSAKYGVIRPGRTIETYDQTMPTNGRPGRWAGSLRRAVTGRDIRFVHVNLGRMYHAAVGDVAALFPKAEVTFAAGGIGQRVSQTAAWVEARIGAAITAGMELPSSHPRRRSTNIRQRNGP